MVPTLYYIFSKSIMGEDELKQDLPNIHLIISHSNSCQTLVFLRRNKPKLLRHIVFKYVLSIKMPT